MYHGVPVVGVPLFGDHYDTMTRVAAKGMGIMLHWKYMTEEDLYAALTRVIEDSRLEVVHAQSHTNASYVSVFVYRCHLLTSHGITTLRFHGTRTKVFF